MKKLTKFAEYVFIGLLFYMPLHVFVSTWVGSMFGILKIAKSFKDIVLFLGLTTAVILWLKLPKVPKKLKLTQDILFVLIGCYTVLTLFLAVIMPTDKTAEILGVVYNLRFFAMFVYGALLIDIEATAEDQKLLQKRSVTAVLLSAGIVTVFGIVQYLILPNDFLINFGYSVQNGVLPAFFIDNKPDLERIMSTVRDPNSLGSYLIIILALCSALLLRLQKGSGRQYIKLCAKILVALTILSIWYTFSRSSWIGSVVALFTVFATKKHGSNKLKSRSNSNYKKGAFILIIILVATLSLLIASKDTYIVKNIVLHSDESTVLEDPNELRVKFIKQSLTNIIENPEGLGPGRAGLVSIKNKKQGTILNENYYLQIATEVGVIGLVLFMLINIIVLRRLFKAPLPGYGWLSAALAASGAGLLFTNLLVHIWSNEAVAYTWWGLSGVCLFVSKQSINQRRKIKTKTR